MKIDLFRLNSQTMEVKYIVLKYKIKSIYL